MPRARPRFPAKADVYIPHYGVLPGSEELRFVHLYLLQSAKIRKRSDIGLLYYHCAKLNAKTIKGKYQLLCT